MTRLIRTTKQTNAILSKAGGLMFKSSLNTARQIANLYKDAGSRAFDLSKDVIKKTVTLTLDNQKELIKTSGKAIIEIAQTISQGEVKSKASSNGKAKRADSKSKGARTKKELTIDDLLN